jgi:hypothetical protein
MAPAMRLHYVQFQVCKLLTLVFCFHRAYALQCTAAVKEFDSGTINRFLTCLQLSNVNLSW